MLALRSAMVPYIEAIHVPSRDLDRLGPHELLGDSSNQHVLTLAQVTSGDE